MQEAGCMELANIEITRGRLAMKAVAALLLNHAALFVLSGLLFLHAIPSSENFVPVYVLACSFAGFGLLRSRLAMFLMVQGATFLSFIWLMPLSIGVIVRNSTL
jgi:hypothetical protein